MEDCRNLLRIQQKSFNIKENRKQWSDKGMNMNQTCLGVLTWCSFCFPKRSSAPPPNSKVTSIVSEKRVKKREWEIRIYPTRKDNRRKLVRTKEKRKLKSGGLDLGFLWRRTARAEHLLGQIEADSGFALVLGDREVVELIKMTLRMVLTNDYNM